MKRILTAILLLVCTLVGAQSIQPPQVWPWTINPAKLGSNSPWSQTQSGIQPTLGFDFTQGTISSVKGVPVTPSFTRATTKTITDWEGLPRLILSGEVPFDGQRRVRNLVLDSENLLSSNWSSLVAGTGTAASATAGFTAPDGTNSAFRVQTNRGAGGTSSDWSFWGNANTTFPAGTLLRGSIWIKSNTGAPQNVALRLTGIDAAAVVVAATTWQRVTWSAVYSASGVTSHTAIGSRGGTFGDQSIDVLVWHPSCEEVTGQSNQNPSEYVPVGAAKSNELVQTDALDQSPWTISSSSVTPNTTTAPDGSLSADTLTSLGGSGNGAIIQQVTLPTSQAYTISGYFKAGTSTRHALGLFDNVGGDWQGLVRISWAAGVPSLHSTIGAVNNLTITDLNGGWYRISFDTVSDAVNTSHGYRIYPDTAAGTETVIAWGTQLVRGTALTSYVQVGNVYPFYGAAVDGVKYFQTLNGNTVSNNVVTEATGQSIPVSGLGIGWSPGGNGSHFTTPDAASNQITGDLWCQNWVSAENYASGFSQYIAGKYDPTGNQRSWLFFLGSTGTLGLTMSLDGVATTSYQSSATHGTPNFTGVWVAFFRRASDGELRFYTSPNGVTWTQLGNAITTTAGNLFNSSSVLAVGGFATGGGPDMRGNHYRMKLATTNMALASGAYVEDFNPSDWAAGGSWTGSFRGETWTLNGGAKVNKWPNKGYVPHGQNTNLVLQSENFGTTWTAVNTPVRTAGALKSGVVSLDLLTDDDAGLLEYHQQAITFTGDAVKALSIYFAQGTSTSSVFRLRDDVSTTEKMKAVITWVSGFPSVAMTTGTLLGVDALANGVFRLRVASTSVTAANGHSVQCMPAADAALSAAATGSIYFGGVQAEDSLYATSYIPTTTATVTRNGDVMNTPTGAWFNPAEGTIVASAWMSDGAIASRRFWSLNDGGATEVIEAIANAADLASYSVVDGVAVVAISGGALPQNAPAKVAAAYKQDDFAIYSTSLATDAVGTLPTVTTLNIGHVRNGGQFIGGIRALDYDNKRLANSTLQALSQ